MSALRILATGFSAFPRAPVNPTEVLMAMLEDTPPDLGSGIEFRTHVLPVEYQRAPRVLCELGAAWRADVAVHFGLAASARGFRLESTARNRSSVLAPDAAGYVPAGQEVCQGPATLGSSLPLGEIKAALKAAGLPVRVSANAGAYLCNHVFYLSRSGSLADFAPAVTGFVHVPFLDEQLAHLDPARAEALFSMPAQQMLRGARIILRVCAEAARNGT